MAWYIIGTLLLPWLFACRSRHRGLIPDWDKCIICITIFNSVLSFQNSVDSDQLGSVEAR